MLIISCSAAKRAHPVTKMPAIERYDGVLFKVLRKALRENLVDGTVDILIISARYGLITPRTRIVNYDSRMTVRSAHQLGPSVRRGIKHRMNREKPSDILINLGQAYAKIIRDMPELRDAVWASGSIGKRAALLKSWLIDDNRN
jgi:cytoplasmic iron level regulating protein YaaA (DUF328/UPF0246 family)